MSQKNPRKFLLDLADRADKIGELAPRYAKLYSKLQSQKVLCAEDVREVVALTPFPTGSQDTVLDRGTGWGRVVVGGALMYPPWKFRGIE